MIAKTTPVLGTIAVSKIEPPVSSKLSYPFIADIGQVAWIVRKTPRLKTAKRGYWPESVPWSQFTEFLGQKMIIEKAQGNDVFHELILYLQIHNYQFFFRIISLI